MPGILSHFTQTIKPVKDKGTFAIALGTQVCCFLSTLLGNCLSSFGFSPLDQKDSKIAHVPFCSGF